MMKNGNRNIVMLICMGLLGLSGLSSCSSVQKAGTVEAKLSCDITKDGGNVEVEYFNSREISGADVKVESLGDCKFKVTVKIKKASGIEGIKQSAEVAKEYKEMIEKLAELGLKMTGPGV